VQCRLAAGDTTGAESLARAAVALAESTDDLELLGYAHAGLGAVLAATGDVDGAAAEEGAAAAAYGAKGDVVSSTTLGPASAASEATRLTAGGGYTGRSLPMDGSASA
jgi:hypothetical protein